MSKATNAVLRNPSLLGEIFSNYYEQLDEFEGRTAGKTCLQAALTCKAFLSPALDVLWREIFDIQLLFQLIPGVVLRDGKLHLDEPFTLNDIECLRGYARRIKSLHMDTMYGDDLLTGVHSVILIQLEILLNHLKEPLFPGLCSLDITTHQDQDGIYVGSPYLFLFASPMLRVVGIMRNDIQFDHFEETWPHRMPTFLLFFQTLAGLPAYRLRSIKTCLALPHSTLARISSLTSLERITLDVEGQSFTTLRDLQLLSTLGRLMCLTVKLYDSGKDDSGLSPAEFSSLQDLTLHSDLQSTKRLLSQFKFPTLEQLKTQFNVQTPGTVELWTQVFSSLTRAAPQLVDLRFLRHQSSLYLADCSSPSVLPLHPFLSLKPLLLTHLTMINPRVNDLSNDKLSQLLSAFPRLARLNIQTVELGTADSSALLKIATDAPNLSDIYMPLRLSEAVPGLPFDPPIIPQNNLKTITFHSITNEQDFVFDPKQIHDVAQFIDALFPNLRIIKCAHAAHKKDFKLLGDFLKGLQAARERERVNLVVQGDKGLQPVC